ncbi:MAG: hypothetical protein ACE5K3_11525 [bacterium]
MTFVKPYIINYKRDKERWMVILPGDKGMQKAKILTHKPKKRLEEVLKAHGLIAKKLENFEERAQQIEMARGVERAIHHRSQVLVVNHYLFFAHLVSGEKFCLLLRRLFLMRLTTWKK